MKKLWVLTMMFIIPVATAAQPPCGLSLTATKEKGSYRYVIRWQAVAGATQYRFEESEPGKTQKSVEMIDARIPDYALARGSAYHRTVPTTRVYDVTAVSGANVVCTESTTVTWEADGLYAEFLQRSAIPLVGSTRGLNGSQFRTSVLLRATQAGQRGKLVFHPEGVPGRSTDPTIRYSFAALNEEKFFEDIVATFGATGLGTIDIIPDEVDGRKLTPFAEARLFNIDERGTYGASESQTQPFAWGWRGGKLLPVQSDPIFNRVITMKVPEATSRMNIGIRTFDLSLVQMDVYRGSTRIGTGTISLYGDTVMFRDVKSFVNYWDRPDPHVEIDVQPGDTIYVWGAGTFVPFYTVTDNRTNDPTIFMAPVRVDIDLTTYDEADR